MRMIMKARTRAARVLFLGNLSVPSFGSGVGSKVGDPDGLEEMAVVVEAVAPVLACADVSTLLSVWIAEAKEDFRVLEVMKLACLLIVVRSVTVMKTTSLAIVVFVCLRPFDEDCCLFYFLSFFGDFASSSNMKLYLRGMCS